MSYPKQESVNARLHKESIKALEAQGTKGMNELGKLWRQHRKEMQLAITNAYNIASRGTGSWTLGSFKATALPTLENELGSVLAKFKASTAQAMKTNLNALYSQSVLRYAWILDQLTPASRNVMIPHRKTLHEAAVTAVFYGQQATDTWDEKWSAWVDSYKSALLHNLALGASNDSPVNDAIAEVDATKSNSPQSTIEAAMIRLYEYAAVTAMAQGAATIGDMNDDSVEVEIWKTQGDLNVCEQCANNEGLSLDDADGTIPAHPNCHCYSLLVPKSYAAILRGGNDDDKALARDMKLQGIVPTALVIRNADGDIAAKTLVSFSMWKKGSGLGIISQ